MLLAGQWPRLHFSFFRNTSSEWSIKLGSTDKKVKFTTHWTMPVTIHTPFLMKIQQTKVLGGGEMSFFNGSSQHYMTSLCWIHTRMQSIFSWLCRMRISVFEVMSLYTSISKCYPKCNAAPWVEKCSTSREFHAHNTRFYWSSENALHEHFITEQWRWVWMETLQLTAPHWKNA